MGEQLALLGPARWERETETENENCRLILSAEAHLYFLCTNSRMASKVRSGAAPLVVESWDTHRHTQNIITIATNNCITQFCNDKQHDVTHTWAKPSSILSSIKASGSLGTS